MRYGPHKCYHDLKMLSEKEKIEAGIAKAERRQEEALLAGDRALAGDIQKQLLVLQEDLKNERKRLENERQRLENERRRQHELVAAQERKKVKVLRYIPPALREIDEAVVRVVEVDRKAFDKFLSNYRGSLLSLGGKSVMLFDAIDENETYRIDSDFYEAHEYGKRLSQVDDDVLALEVGLVVERELNAANPGSAHLHSNIKFPGVEFDGIVVHAGKDEYQDSDAYIVECGYNPDVDDVKSIHDKVRKFRAHHKEVPHFARVKNIVPVLGARRYEDSVLKYCVDNKIWHVKPNGLGYQLVRYFSQVAKKLV